MHRSEVAHNPFILCAKKQPSLQFNPWEAVPRSGIWLITQLNRQMQTSVSGKQPGCKRHLAHRPGIEVASHADLCPAKAPVPVECCYVSCHLLIVEQPCLQPSC